MALTNTITRRLPLIDAESTSSLDERLQCLCTVQFAAGYRLAAMTAVGDDLILVFQAL